MVFGQKVGSLTSPNLQDLPNYLIPLEGRLRVDFDQAKELLNKEEMLIPEELSQ